MPSMGGAQQVSALPTPRRGTEGSVRFGVSDAAVPTPKRSDCQVSTPMSFRACCGEWGAPSSVRMASATTPRSLVAESNPNQKKSGRDRRPRKDRKLDGRGEGRPRPAPA